MPKHRCVSGQLVHVADQVMQTLSLHHCPGRRDLLQGASGWAGSAPPWTTAQTANKNSWGEGPATWNFSTPGAARGRNFFKHILLPRRRSRKTLRDFAPGLARRAGTQIWTVTSIPMDKKKLTDYVGRALLARDPVS